MGNEPYLPSSAAGSLPHGLKVQDFGHFILGWPWLDEGIAFAHPAAGPSQAQVSGKVTAAAMEFGQQRHGDKVERRWVDQQGQGLPLGGREAGLIDQGHYLGHQRLLGVDLGRDVDQPVDRLAGEGLDLLDLGGGRGWENRIRSFRSLLDPGVTVIEMEPFPAVLVGGPPHSGKSVLSYSLSQALRQRGVEHYVVRAAPDGEGDWANEAAQELVRPLPMILDYSQIETLSVPPLPPGRGVVLSGKLPLWLYTSLALTYRAAPWVAVYQPQLEQAVVVYSAIESRAVGQTIPVCLS